MSIKVILYRRVPVAKRNEVTPLLLELRGLALAQPGYISGETLMNSEDSEEVLVISSWTDEASWNRWLENERRREVQRQIDALLGRETMYQVYYNA